MTLHQKNTKKVYEQIRIKLKNLLEEQTKFLELYKKYKKIKDLTSYYEAELQWYDYYAVLLRLKKEYNQ